MLAWSAQEVLKYNSVPGFHHPRPQPSQTTTIPDQSIQEDAANREKEIRDSAARGRTWEWALFRDLPSLSYALPMDHMSYTNQIEDRRAILSMDVQLLMVVATMAPIAVHTYGPCPLGLARSVDRSRTTLSTCDFKGTV